MELFLKKRYYIIYTSINSSRIFIRLQERQAKQAEIEEIFRSLAPLKFQVQTAGEGPWSCHFSPKRVAAPDNDGEYPDLAALTAENVDQWAELAESLNQPMIKARFADAVWELGKHLGSKRKDLYRFGLLAAKMYLDAAERMSKHPFELLNAVTRGIRLAIQLGDKSLLERGFEFMMQYADSVELAHFGLWSAPFDRLLRLPGLSDAQRQRILGRHEERFYKTVASGDIMRVTMAGHEFAKYFYDRKDYQKAKDITFVAGEAVLKATMALDASIATHHIGNVLESYRRVGLKEETDRVRLLLEKRAKGVLAGLKEHRFENKLDLNSIEAALAEMIAVSNPFVALYRLANNCAPKPENVKAQFESSTERLIFHRLFPRTLIGDDGLTVTTIGGYDDDKDGWLAMEMKREMEVRAAFFSHGLEKWKEKFKLGGISDSPKFFDCPLIPEDRVSLFREGLLAFENGDYVKCIHVLLFQVENSLRELLKMLGVPVSKSTDDGYELKNMNDVLHSPTVKDALEPKLWFFLKILYTDKRGMNLRNIVAHGLAPGNAFNRVNAALVVQSVILLSIIRTEAAYVVSSAETSQREDEAQPSKAGSDEVMPEEVQAG